jgi:hypothetical protein
MKITKSQLKQIIKEEISKVIEENPSLLGKFGARVGSQQLTIPSGTAATSAMRELAAQLLKTISPGGQPPPDEDIEQLLAMAAQLVPAAADNITNKYNLEEDDADHT